MMNQMSNAGRAFALLARRNCTALKVKGGRTVTSSGSKGVDSQTSLASETSLGENGDGDTDSSHSGLIDDRISMHLLRKNFSHPGIGLKSSRNRDNLVLDFFNLSKSVLENRLQTDEFVASDTFKELQKQVELNIDFISNAQIVNLLASVITMRINPSTNFVKLLEHEVKFRLKLFNLNQIVKMLKFYNLLELSSEQKQLVDMFMYRIRAYIQTEATTVGDLNAVIELIATQPNLKSLMGSVEERLLGILTNIDNDDDDMVSKYISAPKVFDYDSLCNLFIQLAENRRRPTPLLRAASTELCKIVGATDIADKPNPEVIISTLGSLVSLSYPNRALIAKLIDDLTVTIKFEELDSTIICNLLRTIGTLRWRPDGLLKSLFNFIEDQNNDCKAIDHHVIVALLHISATVNYRPEEGMDQFYNKFMKGTREQTLDRSTRKWLNYVWSLVALETADEAHIRSVLSNEFYKTISTIPDNPKVNHSDIMKLLNLRAIALHELKLDNLNCEHLEPLMELPIQRSNEMQRFASKVNEALNAVVNSSSEIRFAIQTPFGFSVDAELLLNQNMDPIPLEETRILENIESLAVAGVSKLASGSGDGCERCALIYVSYEETIVNYQNEVVGHKQMISRILNNFGFKTKFLPETLMNREKTSADLTNRLKSIIKSSSSTSDCKD